jgi:mannose-1-phosphate guanylyltransferase
MTYTEKTAELYSMINSGQLLEAFEKFQPKMNNLFLNGWNNYNTESEQTFIDQNYGLSENVSIDYAVMENAKNVYVLPATFDWNDLGTWGSLHEKLDKDENNNAVVNATVLLNNASSNIISTSKDKLVIIDGLEDFIIVDKDNVLLIYPKSKEQEIKGIVSNLKK